MGVSDRFGIVNGSGTCSVGYRVVSVCGLVPGSLST